MRPVVPPFASAGGDAPEEVGDHPAEEVGFACLLYLGVIEPRGEVRGELLWMVQLVELAEFAVAVEFLSGLRQG
jgi:hypothetical protein